MKIIIEPPTWIGDAVMATPAIENLISFYNDARISIVGSSRSIEIFKNHPKIENVIFFGKNYASIYSTSKSLGKFDIFFSFRNSFRSNVFKLLVSCRKKFQFIDIKENKFHYVEKYNNFVNQSLKSNFPAGHLKIFQEENLNPLIKGKPILGLNPGASYGAAKRWSTSEFGRVAENLSESFDIIIFGGLADKENALTIQSYLVQKGITNFQNLSGKTSLIELIFNISNLDLFITGDSGPMHIAASFQIPTISIFGPTRNDETSQWKNKKNIIVKKNLICQPCMKRVCPLKHNNCMRLINAEEVLNAVDKLELNLGLKSIVN